MPTPRRRQHLLAGTLLLAACGGDSTAGPTSSGRLEMAPASARLNSTAPGNTLQASLVVRNADGAASPYQGEVLYWTRDTFVIRVDAGTVTALEPGEANVLATVFVGNEPVTTAMPVTVTSTLEPLDLTGTWDLEMLSTAVEPRECWCGPLFGVKFESTVIMEGRSPLGMVGGHGEFTMSLPNGTRSEYPQVPGGQVRSAIDDFGGETLQMAGFVLRVRTVSPDLVTGRFGFGPSLNSLLPYTWAGHFELRRR